MNRSTLEWAEILNICVAKGRDKAGEVGRDSSQWSLVSHLEIWTLSRKHQGSTERFFLAKYSLLKSSPRISPQNSIY